MASRDLRPGGTGQAGRSQVGSAGGRLAAQVSPPAAWQHVATYGDQSLSAGRPGLSRLLAEAPGHIDLVVVDGYGRLSPNRRGAGRAARPTGCPGVRAVVLRPSAGRRLARLVANLALADLIGSRRSLTASRRYRVVSTATSAPAVMKGAMGRTNRRPRPATRPTRTNTAAAPKATSVAAGRVVQPKQPR